MATEDVDAPDSGGVMEDASTDGEQGDSSAKVGEYTWADYLREHGHGGEVGLLYPDEEEDGPPTGDDWDRVAFEPAEHLGFHPDELPAVIAEAAGPRAEFTRRRMLLQLDPSAAKAVKDEYTWEHFKQEYYYEDGEPPTRGKGEDEEIVPFEPEEHLGFDPALVEGVFSDHDNVCKHLSKIVEDRTVTTLGDLSEEDIDALAEVEPEDVEEFDEDEFFTDEDGNTTVVTRYDLEKAVPQSKKSHFREEDRYWVNRPYAFISIFHSVKENEKKYYVVEPYLTEIEQDLIEFLTGKLRTAIKYSDDDIVVEGSEEDRREVIERETRKLLRRYDLYENTDDRSTIEKVKAILGMGDGGGDDDGGLEGIEARPEPAILEEDPERISEYQAEKLLYYLKRDFIGYERIDPIKHDTVSVEDISCDGYNSPVFVYHGEYEQIITNVYHGEEQLDDFVVKLAQRSGKGISKRRPQVDATLPDGSRAQLTLGPEVSDHGTNYTIRQFKDVPFTPLDLICWNTFSLEEMAFLWLCIENHKSLIFAGGTASGKTTSLNAISLFIPSDAKIVSIEDTREVELPQRNWIASVTRPSFGEDDKGDVDEFDLLEAALRQRPDYIVMGEIRGEEGRTAFQVMSTGHTTYTTFHADSVGEVLKRFTTEPINVSKTMFTALDLVSIQTQTRVEGRKVRRNKTLTEINHYDAENDEINVQDVYEWQAETDEFLKMGESNTLEEIMFDRGWSYDKLQEEIFRRETILAYLIENGLNTYAQVAATVQAFVNDPETILALVANEQLERSLEDLREMESVLIEVTPEQEAMAPRPGPDEETAQLCDKILDRAKDSLLDEYRGQIPSGISTAMPDAEEALPPEPSEIVQVPEQEEEIEFTGEVNEDAVASGQFDMVEGDDDPAIEDAEPDEVPALEGSRSVGTTESRADAPVTSEEGDGPEWLFGDEMPGESGATVERAEGGSSGLAPEGDASDGKGLAFGSDGDEQGASEGGSTFGDGSDESGDASGGGGLAFGSDGDEQDGGGEGGLAFGGEESGEGGGDGGGLAFGGEESGEDGGGEGGLAFGGEESGEEGGAGADGSATDEEGDGQDGFAFGDGGTPTGKPLGEGDDGAEDSGDGFAFGSGGEETERNDEGESG